MARDTHVELEDRLPLTCTRGGTCCHGNRIWLNPWELARLAAATGLSPAAFRARYCDPGGTILCFDGPTDARGLAACRLYDGARGCTAHASRPLACRLFPLARRRRGETTGYLHRGTRFPCLVGCPEVVRGPELSVAEYLENQDVAAGEAAQDAYLELMQQLAEGALVLLLDSGLAATGDRSTLRRWRRLGAGSTAERAAALGSSFGANWLDELTVPALAFVAEDPAAFARRHHDALQELAQTRFANLADAASLSAAAVVMMALALHLGEALGADPSALAAQWVATAREHGARE